jgi:Cys-rich repeat protein
VCVECLSDMNCDGGEPHCAVDEGRCVECVSDADCDGGEPHCSPRNRCAECLTDADCSPGETCDPQDFSCQG